MRKPYLLAFALGALALFFGLQARQALVLPPPALGNIPRDAATGWQPGAPAPDPPPPPDTAAAAVAVKSRPLFRQDRQPYREPVAGAVPVRNYEAELSRFSLIGIMVIGGDQKGIVVGKGGGRGERWELKAGDPLPGFQVKEVRSDGLAVTADGRDFLLPLYGGAPTAVGGAAVRTEVPRKDAAPAPAPPAAAVPAPAQPRPAAPPAAVQPAAPAAAAPVVAPRYIPGRR